MQLCYKCRWAIVGPSLLQAEVWAASCSRVRGAPHALRLPFSQVNDLLAEVRPPALKASAISATLSQLRSVLGAIPAREVRWHDIGAAGFGGWAPLLSGTHMHRVVCG